MDGRRQETSVRLIAASIPVQALMMAGVAALVLGTAAHPRPAPSIQVSPAQLTKPAPGYLDPVETCWSTGSAAAVPPQEWKRAVIACAWVQAVPGSAPAKVTVTTEGPCCGG